ncbi:MAG: hypothetical protein V1897_06865 [Pseudomonadota bacterium]
MDEEGYGRLFGQIHDLWVQPEVSKRKAAGSWPQDFKIYRCRVLLPKNAPAIVQFNDEIGWEAAAKAESAVGFVPGRPVYLEEIKNIDFVHPPKIQGQRVAFVYVYFNGKSYDILYDFTPNVPDEISIDREWRFGTQIAKSLEAILAELSIKVEEPVEDLLKQIGLWFVPALLPYPISRIIKQLLAKDKEAALTTLVTHCNEEFVRQLTGKWFSIDAFSHRKSLISTALDAHYRHEYALSIHALLPQLEGIITDWVYTKVTDLKDVPWRQESKTKKFRDLVLADPPETWVYQRVVESTIAFIVGGPVLETFNEWNARINEAFPNRHVLQHGRYEDALMTEENSLKLILLLDSVYYIVSPKSVHSSNAQTFLKVE